jgi:hypothetical protein
VRHRCLNNGDQQHAGILRRAVGQGGENAVARRRLQRGNFGSASAPAMGSMREEETGGAGRGRTTALLARPRRRQRT